MSSDTIPTCWRRGDSTVYNTNGSDVPCGGPGPASCCVHGSFCLSNSICENRNAGKGQSGYYMSSCTDETYASSACPRQCTRFRVPDVVYNYTTSLWYCCGYDNVKQLYGCGDPLDTSFQAPPPSQLSTVTSLAASGWTLAPSATASSSTSSSPTADTSPAQAGLSTGAKAGIGAGVAVGALVVAGLIGFVILGKKRRKKKSAITPTPTPYQTGALPDTKRDEKPPHIPEKSPDLSELGTSPAALEMSAVGNERQELEHHVKSHPQELEA